MVELAAKFRSHFEKAASGQFLSEAETREAFSCIMQGGVPDIKLAAFLVALRARGETVDEISGAASAMRELMIPVVAPEGAIDIVGTGGDAKGTFNISTATAFVLAAAGVPVAKHGNRAISSKSGSADVLEKLGVNIMADPRQIMRCFEKAGIAFLWAPNHHPAMRYAGPVRQALELRTIFNLLGPLLNPASTRRQLMGVYSAAWLMPVAQVMKRLGGVHVWVVHGADGMDELSTTGVSQVVELKGDEIRSFEIHPRDAGIPEARIVDLAGGTPEDSARAIRALFRGEGGYFRDIVLLNAAAAFIVAGRARSLPEGVALAAESIDAGHAEATLDALISASNEMPQKVIHSPPQPVSAKTSD